MRLIRFILSLTGTAMMAGLTACHPRGAPVPTDSAGATSVREFRVAGVIREPVQDGQLVIEHEEIPGFMPAMTMPFYVADVVEAARLEVGDKVRFRFVVGATSHADRFEVVGRDVAANGRVAIDARISPPKRLKVGDVVPDFALVDQREQPVTASELDGKLTLVTFIFTRCPVPEFCPAMMLRYREVQSRIKDSPVLRERVRLVAVSLDPEYDRPEVLAEYGAAFGLDAGVCRLVTGDAHHVETLTKAFSVHSEQRAGTLDHTLCTALIGSDRRVIELWRGNGWKTEEVVTSLSAAAGAI